jgi:F0F1-type ATP synthase assembly protein I
MRYPEVQFRRSARSAALFQIILVALVALPFFALSEPGNALAVAFGGLAVATGTAVYASKLAQVTRPDGSLDPAPFFQGAILKVFLTVTLLVFGMGPLHLYPPALSAGAAAAYVAMLFVRSSAPRSRAKPEGS